MAPGTFSVSANGPGLSDTKTYFRGFQDGFYSKRVGQMYNDNGSLHQAVAIDPFNITNLLVNDMLRGSSKFSETRIRFAVNNLTDSHAITAVTPESTKSNAPAPGDVLTLMSGRSVSVSLTVGFSPRTP
jgi:iron complex outermembrane recepter protein